MAPASQRREPPVLARPTPRSTLGGWLIRSMRSTEAVRPGLWAAVLFRRVEAPRIGEGLLFHRIRHPGDDPSRRSARAINLGQGFPDFRAPEKVKEAARRAIAVDHNQYPVTWGVPARRSRRSTPVYMG